MTTLGNWIEPMGIPIIIWFFLFCYAALIGMVLYMGYKVYKINL